MKFQIVGLKYTPPTPDIAELRWQARRFIAHLDAVLEATTRRDEPNAELRARNDAAAYKVQPSRGPDGLPVEFTHFTGARVLHVR